MLVIRQAQVDVLAAAMRRRFEDEMTSYLREHFPARARAEGEAGLRRLVRDGEIRAARHGVHVAEDVCRFITMMCVLGASFDEDPGLPWVREILASPHFDSAGARVRYLYAEASARQAPVRR